MKRHSLYSRSAFAFVIFFTFFCIPLTSFALETEGKMVENYFRVIWGMLIVLGVILLLYALLRKRFSLYTASPNQRIKVVEIKPLMQKKSLCLVEVNEQEYLIGISGDRIDHIATLSKTSNVSFAETLQSEERDNQP